MRHEINERSYGVVPLAMREGELYALVVQQRSSSWHLPKGHPELSETPQETAERELKEETNLDIERWLSSQPFVERYSFYRGTKRVNKEVQYFPALVCGIERIPSEEILAGRWVKYADLPTAVTFPELRRLAGEVVRWVESYQPPLQ